MIRVGKVLDRMNRMLDNAISGKETETEFDESKMSALETKLNRYLTITNTKTQQMKEEKEKVKSLISDISHQTKTPIANLVLYSSLLCEQQDLPSEAKELAGQIVHQSQKLDFLIHALIKSSRLETGMITVQPAQNSLKEMIDTALFQLMAKAVEKNIAIEFDGTEETATFDMKWTTEAFYNVLDNAVKYSLPGDSVHITVTPYEMFCRIDVKDQGIGIGEEEQSRIFARFYRSPKVADMEGAGIGLYLSREILTLQGGYMKVSSEPDKGSTFSLFLPK